MQAGRMLLVVAGLCVATVSGAHQGVQNPAVMARMNAMSDIGKSTELMVDMAKGKSDFDAAQARNAADVIAREAARTPALFAAPETDPKSEALPEIWNDQDDFASRARLLETVARDAATSLKSEQDLRRAVAEIADACKSCHRLYRE